MMTFADHDDYVRTGGTALESRLPRGRSNRIRTWLSAGLVLLVFLAGLVCGAAIIHISTESDSPENWHGLLDRVAKRMQRDLDLTEAQRADVEQVVRAHQPNLDQIHARTVKEMRAELQQVIEEMSAALTPEQARRFRAETQPRLDEHFPADIPTPMADSQ